MSGASFPGKVWTGIGAEGDVFSEVGHPVTASGGLEGGPQTGGREGTLGWVSGAFCLCLVASFWEVPLPYACGPVDCPSRRCLPPVVS